MDLTDRCVLVTGASSGIGRETAILLSSLNARVILSARREAKLRETRDLLYGSGHVVAPFDFSDAAEIPNWIKSLVGKTAPLDAVIHVAGQQVTGAVNYLVAEDVDGLLRLSVTSALMLARGVAQRGCSASRASIVFVASIMGLVGKPGIAVYAAAKSALIGTTKSLAVELAPRNIRVNCVAPAFVETEMLDHLREVLAPDQFDLIRKAHPLGFGTPSDVANPIAFLAGDAARWITGTTLVVDGGYSAQ